jgi:hypothetical protein
MAKKNSMRVDPPAGFIDDHPDRGPWFIEEVKPSRFATVQLVFGDGATTHGVWTGLSWWSHFQARVPLGWRQMPEIGLVATHRSTRTVDLRTLR